jgi:hypothetical protein
LTRLTAHLIPPVHDHGLDLRSTQVDSAAGLHD